MQEAWKARSSAKLKETEQTNKMSRFDCLNDMCAAE